MRFVQHFQPVDMRLPPDLTEERMHLTRRSASVAAAVGVMKSISESSDHVRASGNFGDKPLIVLASTKPASDADVRPGMTKKEHEA